MLNTFSRAAIGVLLAAGGLTASLSVQAQGAAKASAQPAAAAVIVGSAEAGAKKNSMCIGCHGIADYKTAFPTVYRVPKINSQSEKYIVSALNAYKSGERNHPSMVGISRSLSDQDMADLAAYYANKK
ncbi:MAG: cytochrome c [Betaproteobacteria bacterium]|jgi:cytochrome c553|nr:cytochrome c [Betaproteobacteria bacterium]